MKICKDKNLPSMFSVNKFTSSFVVHTDAETRTQPKLEIDTKFLTASLKFGYFEVHSPACDNKISLTVLMLLFENSNGGLLF